MNDTVAILGAHTELARAIAEQIELRDLDVTVVRATTSDHVEGDLDLIDADLIERADLFVHTFGGPVAAGLATGLSARGALQIDLTGSLLDVEWVFPVLDAGAADKLRSRRAVRIFSGPAEPVAAVLAALSVFGPVRAHVTTLESAATFDRPGMDELSEQTRAVFTLQDRSPQLFGATLAFGMIADVTGGDDALAADRAFEVAVAGGLDAAGAPSVEIRAARVLVPSFSAEGAIIDCEVNDTPDLDTVARALGDSKAAVYKDGPGSYGVDVIGRDDAILSRLFVDGHRIQLWLLADRLRRGGAVPTALLVERWLDASNGVTA